MKTIVLTNITNIRYRDIIVIDHERALEVVSVFGSKSNKKKYPKALYFYGNDRLKRFYDFLKTRDISYLEGDCVEIETPSIDFDKLKDLTEELVKDQSSIESILGQLALKNIFIVL